MPYRRSNYSFVIDSNFQPFTLQEMLVPFTAYKDAYEKSEAAFEDLTSKSDKFKYLSETLPEGSKARQLYEGYANELDKQAQDLAKNGLSMGNRRALTNLKKRYQGEIGRLVDADTAMQEEKKLRRTMNAKDSSMLYATDNMSIDDFLDGSTPNLYNISGTELYTRGAAAGKAASSRVYSAGDEGSTLGGYYRKWVERNGYSKESMDAFRANASAIPELQQAADAILAERGAAENLTGNNLERARQSVINGIIDGAVYQEKVNPVRDAGVMSASEAASNARANRAQAASEALQGITWVNGRPVYNKDNDISLQRQLAIAKEKASSSGSSTSNSKKSGTDRVTQLKGRLKLTWDSGNPEENADDAKKYTPTSVANDEAAHPGPLVDYDSLPTNIQKEIDKVIGDGNEGMYNYYYKPHDSSAWWGGQPEIEIEPRDIKIVDQATEDLELLQGLFGNS